MGQPKVKPGLHVERAAEKQADREVKPGLHAERAAEKQVTREQDWADIREKRRTADQVNRDNSIAPGLVHRFKMRRELGVR